MALSWPRSYAEQTNRPVIALIDIIEEGHATLKSGTQHERYHLIDNLKQKNSATTGSYMILGESLKLNLVILVDKMKNNS